MSFASRNFLRLRFASSNSSAVEWNKLKFKSKVPQHAVKSSFSEKTTRIKITEGEMNLLERLSLVDLDRKEAVKVLEDSIEFASKIQNIDTTNVEPLYTVLENHPLQLRDDKVSEGNMRDKIMRNAKKTEDDIYFIAPVGNVALK